MKWMFACMPLIVLCTCGRAQDTPVEGEGETRVADRERVFNGAYENLDAAVLERLLAPDYTVDYQGTEAARSREQFVDELAQLRLVFPDLHITIDSTTIASEDDGYRVEGLRTFHWRAHDTPGSYRERFTNRWERIDGTWLLAATTLQAADR